MFNSYIEARDWINSIIPFGIKPGLERMKVLMERLDNPHRRLKFIHVAGTNGKGSTCAYLSQVLQESGYDVGMFTSPYIQKFTDRIQMNGKDIPEEVVLSLVNELKPIVDEVSESELGSPTMFEITTTLAILYFSRVSYPDYVILETGLGGLYDSTNIVIPITSVITNIGHDHMDILGDTISEISVQKAGIIKAGIPVISAVEQDEAIEVIKHTSAEKRSTLYLLNEQFQYEMVSMNEKEQCFHFQGPFRSIDSVAITNLGEHQFKNAAVAMMVLEVLRQYQALIVEEDDLKRGFKKTKWPGRFEFVGSKPRVLLDGAHNPEGAEYLAKTIQDLYTGTKVHLMVGMLDSKNHRGYLEHILPVVKTLVITEPDFRNKCDAQKLYEITKECLKNKKFDVEIIVEPEWKKALEYLINKTNKHDLAAVSGTLYLISDVRSNLLHYSDSEKGW
ncbi:bifunctional folylpolyglutamate synthase/dihydrofolate synthase [Chengkuizengella axinellae]|uniref:tetrahydrofolate synthase n=1 Tax=Chengkuizengella axinellae TaxID=3064388 RepID=A0ABT9IV71_9BACL|nr:folylpolyglutamate synthase/dihydrofolate synthase family protein [Chengkuizengella sp. 2205SS18-9]MDP5272715.1 folylpolyglutamate synthase/dihydrofolate synthase family protein [Chengkuizengella sp. 2205SS18-9]